MFLLKCLYIWVYQKTKNKNNTTMKTPIYNESKDRNATATELARNIMNSAVELAIESVICDFQADPKYCGEGLAQLNEDQKKAVLEAMNKISATLWPKNVADIMIYQ